MHEKFPYEDIIDLPRPVSATYPQPTMPERAARFAPFAAITGYEEMVLEEARTTEDWNEPDESAKSELNGKLQLLLTHLQEEPVVTFTYFEPDKWKSGGAYRRLTGVPKKLDSYRGHILLTDGKQIPIERICHMESDLFSAFPTDTEN